MLCADLEPDVWLQLTIAASSSDLANPDSRSLNVWGRLHVGVERSQLRVLLQAVLTNFLRERIRINPPRNLHGSQLQQFAEAPLLVRDASGGLESAPSIELADRSGSSLRQRSSASARVLRIVRKA